MVEAIRVGVPLEEQERLLAMVDILEVLPPEEIERLARRSSFLRIRAGEEVTLSPEEHGERMLLLLSGRAWVYEAAPHGREPTVSVVEAGTVVGVSGLASCRSGELRVEALAPSVACLLEWQTFEELVHENPNVGIRLLRNLGEQIVTLETRLAELAHEEVLTRLASAILRLVEGEGVVTREGYSVPTKYTHQQLASMVGSKREAVTRAFAKLREIGAVEVRLRRIHVTDLEALERAANLTMSAQ